MRSHWAAVRCGDLPSGGDETLDWDEKPLRHLELFLGRLINRLALTSQAMLASVRLLLLLLEESGISVRNAHFELMYMGQQSQPVSTDRLVQSAEFYVISMQPPNVQGLAVAAGSLLGNLFCHTAAHIQYTGQLKSIFYADEHARRLSIYRTVFSWMHFADAAFDDDVVDDDEKREIEGPPESLHQMIRMISNSMELAEIAIAEANGLGCDEAEEICALGKAVCEAEQHRIQ